MVEKRPLDDLESYNVISPAKHARQGQTGECDDLVLFPSTENASLKQPHTTDCEGDVGLKNSDIGSSKMLEEHINAENSTRTVVRSQDIYSILLHHHPPRKLIPIGTNHQVDIPDFMPNARENDDRNLIGTCVVPMPHSEPSVSDSKKIDCSCSDEGSVRCVRQHISEAREKLLETLGLNAFLDLGFGNMGEQVAEKWSQEEEQLFHEVIFSNPASLGKKFWHGLYVIFPSRTKKEIVSYYFNVFILRRRAEQNRCEAMNIDSDNDELQGTDDYCDNEEDEDSVVESPVLINGPSYTSIQDDDLHLYEEISAVENYGDYCKAINFTTVNNQDDSCTTTDTGPCSQQTQTKDDNGKHYSHSFEGLGSERVHGEYFLEHKVWDSSNSDYLSCADNKFEFLPTCSMMKEVFGDELHGRDSTNKSSS
ncbi:hypothetical protein ACFE04_025209 [Oxalis oulophora]